MTYSFIDTREILMQRCLQRIVENKSELPEQLMDFSMHDFAEWLKNIHNMYGSQIDTFPDVAACIDAVF
jgi:hypothetical protein